MPRGDKSAYSEKQKRKAEHIEESYEKRGVGKKESERRAWATVNKESGGGNKSGSGRGRKADKRRRQAGGRDATAFAQSIGREHGERRHRPDRHQNAGRAGGPWQ